MRSDPTRESGDTRAFERWLRGEWDQEKIDREETEAERRGDRERGRTIKLRIERRQTCTSR